MSDTFKTTVYREENDKEIEVKLWVEIEGSPASRGARDSYGVPLEPDDEASLEILGAYTADGKEFVLTDEETQSILNEYDSKPIEYDGPDCDEPLD